MTKPLPIVKLKIRLDKSRKFFLVEDPSGRVQRFGVSPDCHLENHDIVWFTWDKDNRELTRRT